MNCFHSLSWDPFKNITVLVQFYSITWKFIAFEAFICWLLIHRYRSCIVPQSTQYVKCTFNRSKTQSSIHHECDMLDGTIRFYHEDFLWIVAQRNQYPCTYIDSQLYLQTDLSDTLYYGKHRKVLLSYEQWILMPLIIVLSEKKQIYTVANSIIILTWKAISSSIGLLVSSTISFLNHISSHLVL